MPPRRSAQASVAPSTTDDSPLSNPKATRASASKRKRTAPVDEENETDEDASSQPATTGRRARSLRGGAVSISNRLTTSRKLGSTIATVAESSEEEKLPVKKARSSLGSEGGSSSGENAETTATPELTNTRTETNHSDKDPSSAILTQPDSVSAAQVTNDVPASGQMPNPIPQLEPPNGPIARLVIHKLVLVDFKSYAGRQVIGPFHKVFFLDKLNESCC
jgi:structural maintenance of chromosome 4